MTSYSKVDLGFMCQPAYLYKIEVKSMHAIGSKIIENMEAPSARR